MKPLELLLQRDEFGADYTLGKLFADGRYFGEICEDKDRYLENGGQKVYGETAIPRGRYRVVLSFSQRFGRVMPEVLGVPQFKGIRFHGGNSPQDTEGCLLLGRNRKAGGVFDCHERNETLILLIENAEEDWRECWLEVV